MRLAVVGTLFASLALAPYQCKRDPDAVPRREDTAGDALWNLSLDFEARGNTNAARDTRRYLLQHYPSNRHASEARSMLELTDAGGGAD
jgi:hypothetical protein